MVALLVCLALANSGCFEGERGEQFYGKANVPRAQEFRWSDGGLPKIFDPALAAAPPDTDAVRAMFEGLTDYDPRQLKPVSAVAVRWESSPDKRRWTFHLRKNARWSNGDAVTAHDFVRSWRRTLRFGGRAPHVKLMENIDGARALLSAAGAAAPPPGNTASVGGQAARIDEAEPVSEDEEKPFGAAALDDYVLQIYLQRPDENLPELLAHPVFRPVHEVKPEEAATGEGQPRGDAETSALRVVSNGAFRLSAAAPDGVVLERDKNYWDAGAVALERVRFVAAQDAEQALAAYRMGEVDAVTNASLEPLALKLLIPYKDFHRATYGALTYYAFNTAHAPFDDVRVRRALSLAVDRDRISADTMEGMTKPATRFLPPAGDAPETKDIERGRTVAATKTTPTTPTADADQARRLMAEAGFPGGANFPPIRLLVNRNDQHRQVAQAVARMWQAELGVRAEIIIKEWEEYEAAFAEGEYDVARRGLVMQTIGEEANILEMFESGERVEKVNENLGEAVAATPSVTPLAESSPSEADGAAELQPPRPVMTTEAQALSELPGMPIYFASSNALVKPYIAGFAPNLLGVYSLKNVRVDTNWKPVPAPQVIGIARNE